MTELLAPAGNMEALRAAIANGADAIYVGGKSFSARAFAGNFDDEELAEAVRLVHFHGKKIYLAINTLIADNEMEEALRYMKKVYEMGIDAAIIQDAGLWRLLRKALPDLPLRTMGRWVIRSPAERIVARPTSKTRSLSRGALSGTSSGAFSETMGDSWPGSCTT